jgi:acetyl-CoA carboxylase biotin carboxyl carrier protein
MILTANDIAEITRLLDESHYSQLRLEIGDFKLRISRGRASRAPRDFASTAGEEHAAPVADQVPTAAPASENGPRPGEADVKAPLLGNYYQAPRPGDPPFVEVGDRVSEDSVIGIIEVMKLMNSVRAGVVGTVVAHLVQNGTAVEHGQSLIRVKTDG